MTHIHLRHNFCSILILVFLEASCAKDEQAEEEYQSPQIHQLIRIFMEFIAMSPQEDKITEIHVVLLEGIYADISLGIQNNTNKIKAVRSYQAGINQADEEVEYELNLRAISGNPAIITRPALVMALDKWVISLNATINLLAPVKLWLESEEMQKVNKRLVNDTHVAALRSMETLNFLNTVATAYQLAHETEGNWEKLMAGSWNKGRRINLHAEL